MYVSTVNGFWIAEFGTSAGMVGAGVALFQDGKIFGGDSLYYYLGQYSVNGEKFQATLRVIPFIAGAESVFKTVGKELTLRLEGSLVSSSHATAQGSVVDLPGLQFGVKLTKRA